MSAEVDDLVYFWFVGGHLCSDASCSVMVAQLMPRPWGPGGSWGWAQEFRSEGSSRRREYDTYLETLRLRVESSPLPWHPSSKHCWFLHTFFPISFLLGSQPGVNLIDPLPSPMSLRHMATRLVLVKLHLAYASLTAWRFQWLHCVYIRSPNFFTVPTLMPPSTLQA